jgi:deoxyribonuclease V
MLRKMLCDHEHTLPPAHRPAPADAEDARHTREPAVAARTAGGPIEACWWPESRTELARLQRRLARRVREVEPWQPPPGKDVAIGGVFAALQPGTRSGGRVAWAAAVVLHGHQVVATATATRTFPEAYQPGYYALTTGPILQDVVQALSHRPDVLIVNRAGRDHVRGAGLAVQLGAALDIPTIGITEHPFAAEGSQPGAEPLSSSPLRSEDGVVGFRVRTTAPSQPITVHAGWRTEAETAREMVLRCTKGMRIPEPLRRARDLAIWLRPETRPS